MRLSPQVPPARQNLRSPLGQISAPPSPGVVQMCPPRANPMGFYGVTMGNPNKPIPSTNHDWGGSFLNHRFTQKITSIGAGLVLENKEHIEIETDQGRSTRGASRRGTRSQMFSDKLVWNPSYPATLLRAKKSNSLVE